MRLGAGAGLHRGAALLCVAAVLGCAHERARPPDATPAPVWPAPPEAPQARYLDALPDPLAPPPARSLWSDAWDFIIGQKAAETERVLFERPFGVAARGDDLFVADPDGRQVVRIAWPSRATSPLRCDKRPWAGPMAVAAPADGAVYVADTAAAAIVRVDGAGSCAVFGAGALQRPTGVTFAAGRLYVVDPPAHAVVAFSPDGRELFRFGGRGGEGAQLNFPTGIASRSDGTLLVVDTLNFRIASFTPEGGYIGSVGEAGDGSGAFGRPKAVATDEGGRMFVSDAQHDVVVVFGRDGGFAFAIGGSGADRGHLLLPAGVAVAGQVLFVADAYNRRVVAYQLLGGER